MRRRSSMWKPGARACQPRRRLKARILSPKILKETRIPGESLLMSYPALSSEWFGPIESISGFIGTTDGTSSLERQGDCRKREDADGGGERVLPRIQPEERVFSSQHNHLPGPGQGAGTLYDGTDRR